MLESQKNFTTQYFLDHPEAAASSLSKWDSSSIADFIVQLEPEALVNSINRLPAQMLSEVFLKLEESFLCSLFSKIEITLTARILRQWYIDNKIEKADSVVSKFSPEFALKIKELVAYPEDIVGALMNPTPFTVGPSLTIANVLEVLKKQKSRYSRYVYIVDSEKKLIGIIPFKDIFYGDTNQLISESMSSQVYSLNVFSGVEAAWKDNAWTKWDSLPVVDSKNRLQGVLKYEVLNNKLADFEVSNLSNEHMVRAGSAVGEILQIGLNATVSAFSGKKGDNG